MQLINDIRKYVRYVLEAKPFVYDGDEDTPAASDVARATTQRPAIFIHGIMPRAGTVYVGQLLRLHPDLHAFPREIWELPTLQLTPDIHRLQRKFLSIYEQNTDKLGDQAFLEIVGRGTLSYLHAVTPPGRRMLLKVPSVHYLHSFSVMYPGQHMLLLVRDGRDVAQSTVKTWPMILFPFACRRWQRAAEMVAAYHERHEDQPTGYWLARFEDAVTDPDGFVQEACQRFGLDVDRYPFEAIQSIRIHGSSQTMDGGKVTWDAKAKPPGFLPMGYWHDWSGWRKRTFKHIAGQALMSLGYCEDLQW